MYCSIIYQGLTVGVLCGANRVGIFNLVVYIEQSCEEHTVCVKYVIDDVYRSTGIQSCV